MKTVLENFKRFLRDDQGSMMVEFVIWIPWLLFYLLFSTTAFLAMDSRLEAMRASIMLTDAASRQEVIDTDWLTNAYAMMGELTSSAAPGAMYRISVVKAEAGAVSVKWTTCFGGIEALTNENMPVELLPPMTDQDERILVETFIPYQPISRVFGIRPQVWTNRKIVDTRWIEQLGLDPGVVDNCGSTSVG